jgi:hypothetical protein
MKVSIVCRKINQVKTALTATTAYSEGCIEGRASEKIALRKFSWLVQK